MDCLKSKIVKLRKPCKCWGCAREFQKGEVILKMTHVDQGEFSHTAWCEVCNAYWNENMTSDDTFDIGELRACDPDGWLKMKLKLEGLTVNI